MNARELNKLVVTLNYLSMREMNELANALFEHHEEQASRFKNYLIWAEMECGTKNCNVYDSGAKR